MDAVTPQHAQTADTHSHLVRPASIEANGHLFPDRVIRVQGEELLRFAGIERGQPLLEQRGKGHRRGGRSGFLGENNARPNKRSS